MFITGVNIIEKIQQRPMKFGENRRTIIRNVMYVFLFDWGSIGLYPFTCSLFYVHLVGQSFAASTLYSTFVATTRGDVQTTRCK